MKNQRMLQITALDADYNSLLGEHLPFTKERLTRHWDRRLVTLYFIYLQIKNQSCGSRRSPPHVGISSNPPAEVQLKILYF
jgi:hypothetical protein